MNCNLSGEHSRFIPLTLTKTMHSLGVAMVLCLFCDVAPAQEPRGSCSLEFSSAAVDYRPEKYVWENTYKSHRGLLHLVEEAHFTSAVESLRSGKLGGTPGGDINYTLRVYPNHHRALLAMVRLGEKDKTDLPIGAQWPVECYFSRAIKFRPDDNIVRMIYSQFLAKANRNAEAERQLEVAAKQAGDNPFTHLNIGLVYFDMKSYDKALIQAHKAYELGLDRPVLRDQLKGVGKWVELGTTQPDGQPQKSP